MKNGGVNCFSKLPKTNSLLLLNPERLVSANKLKSPLYEYHIRTADLQIITKTNTFNNPKKNLISHEKNPLNNPPLPDSGFIMDPKSGSDLSKFKNQKSSKTDIKLLRRGGFAAVIEPMQ